MERESAEGASRTLLLDTTVLIDALRGRPAADRLLGLRSRGTVPFTSPISVEEIWRGVRREEEEPVRQLFAGLHVVVLGQPEGERAGTWRHEFAARGVTLSQADCLIAAAAVALDARLATGNPKDFPMPELDVEHWPVGG